MSSTNTGYWGLLEKELKYELSKADYLKLIRAVKNSRTKKLKLINYYFDDGGLRLRKKKFALRIRIINQTKGFLTLKYPAKQPRSAPSALKVRIEHEVSVPLVLAKKLLKQQCSISDVNLGPIRMLKRSFSKDLLEGIGPLGLIETSRTVVPFDKKIELEIDSCKMFNKKFYELEVETNQPSRVDKVVRVLLKEHGIPYLPLTRSKFGRFIEEWKNRRD